MLCLQSTKPGTYTNYELTDNETYKLFGIKKFSHSICHECTGCNQITTTKQIFCQICNSMHNLKSPLDVNGNNRTEEGCKMF